MDRLAGEPGHDAYWYYRDSFSDLAPGGAGARSRWHLRPRRRRRAALRRGAFDVVVAYNSLMDVDDLPWAVRETGRVLEPTGRFCVCVTHPFFDAGAFGSRDPDARFVMEGSYLGKRRFERTFARRGLEITFRGWCYPLSDYGLALEDAGFLIERIREPVAMAEGNPRHARMPLFLQLRAVKPA